MGDPAARVQLAVIAAILVLATGAGAWWGSRGAAGVPLIVDEAPPPAAGDGEHQITVHVAGAVTAPGLVSVPADARVAAAIAAAGGATPTADLAAVNLAAPLRDGDQIVIPAAGAPSPGAAGAAEGIDLNRATASQLESLPGVGPVLAARIEAYREAHGPFRSVEDLLDVPGIGEAKLAQLRDAVRAP